MTVPSEQSLPALFLICRSRLRLCALPLQFVRETMRALALEAVPHMPPFLLGVSVIRGQVVPVVDLACLTTGASPMPAERYVTLVLGERQVALAVDDVIGVHSLPPSALGDVPPLLESAEAGMLSALTMLDAELLLVLQATHLIPDQLWPLLAAQAAAA